MLRLLSYSVASFVIYEILPHTHTHTQTVSVSLYLSPSLISRPYQIRS